MAKPEKKIKVGACTASVFANEVDTKTGRMVMKSVSLQRTYKDKNGEFQNATSFTANDMPKAVLALSKAYEYLIIEQRSD